MSSEITLTGYKDWEWYIRHGHEERYLEYKGAMTWKDDRAKVVVARAIMAMSNLRDGGVIVVGVKEVDGCTWRPEGLTTEQASSFKQDDLDAWVNGYADPAAQFSVTPFASDGKQFVLIQVQEFGRVPVICQRPFPPRNGPELLKRGAIYYRSNKKNESAPIASEEDLRELIELAIGKGVGKGVELHVERLRKLGLVPSQSELEESDRLKFEKEREGL